MINIFKLLSDGMTPNLMFKWFLMKNYADSILALIAQRRCFSYAKSDKKLKSLKSDNRHLKSIVAIKTRFIF